MKPPSLLKLFVFRCISVASFTRWPKYPDVLSNIRGATEIDDFTGWYRCIYLWCSLHLASIVLPLCPTYTSLHSHGICFTPETLSSNPSLAGEHWYSFPVWDMNRSDIMFLQKFVGFIADGVMKQYHDCTCGLCVFQFSFQF
jgi:hypothetical protein